MHPQFADLVLCRPRELVGHCFVLFVQPRLFQNSLCSQYWPQIQEKSPAWKCWDCRQGLCVCLGLFGIVVSTEVPLLSL